MHLYQRVRQRVDAFHRLIRGYDMIVVIPEAHPARSVLAGDVETQ